MKQMPSLALAQPAAFAASQEGKKKQECRVRQRTAQQTSFPTSESGHAARIPAIHSVCGLSFNSTGC